LHLPGGGLDAAVTASTETGGRASLQPEDIPQARVLGDEAGLGIQRHLETAGIRFEAGVFIAAITGESTVTGVELTGNVSGRIVLQLA
jgi:hypothetical protein